MVGATVLSAIMTLVVPRAIPVRITRSVFLAMRTLFKLRGGRARSFEERDRDMALFGPISLFSLTATWLVLTGFGYMLLFWSLGVRPLRQARSSSAARRSTPWGSRCPRTCRPRCWPSPRPASAWSCWPY
jgi:hypothetical protein